MSPSPRSRLPVPPLASLALAGLALSLLPGCDQGPSGRVLERRIQDLEDKIKVLDRRAEAAMLAAESGGQDFKQRLESVEQKAAETLEQSASLSVDIDSRFQRVEQSVSNVMRIKEESEAVAYLEPAAPGHRTLQTEHGTFLVRLEGLDRDLQRGGFVAILNIGNPMGLEVQEFRLKGDFGLPAPKLEPGEAYGDYSRRLDEWQKTMTPFEEVFAEPVLPNAWTRVPLPLNASGESDLQLIRVAMVVQRARLANQEGADAEFSVINADNDGANLVKTDYGPLLITVTGMVPEGGATRVNLMVGNPFGFAINEGTLSGQFGPAPPRRMDSEAPALFQQRLQLWSEQMEPFEARLTSSIAPLRWSEASFTLPGSDPTRMKYLRVRMQVTNITLPRTP